MTASHASTTRAADALLRALAVAAGALAVLDCGVFLASVGPLAWDLLVLVAPTVGALLAAATGVGILVRWPVQSGARPLGASLALAGFAWSELLLVPLTPPLGISLPHVQLFASAGTAGLLLERADYLALWLAAAAFLRFAATFPRPLREEDFEAVARLSSRERAETMVVGRLTAPVRRLGDRVAHHIGAHADRSRLARLLVRDMTPRSGSGADRTVLTAGRVVTDRWLPWSVALGVGGLLVVVGPGSAWALTAEYVLALALPVVALTAIQCSYRLAAPADKRRMMWMVEGFALGGLVSFAGFLLFTSLENDVFSEMMVGTPNAVGFHVALTLLLAPVGLVYTAGILMAVFYDGAVDPGLALRRTTLYGLLGVAVVFVFGAVETVLSDHVIQAMGLPPDAGGWIAGGTAALAVTPIQAFLRGQVDRVLGPGVADATNAPPDAALGATPPSP